MLPATGRYHPAPVGGTTDDEVIARHGGAERPLGGFSPYLSGRDQVLLDIAGEIVGQLDAASEQEGPGRRASDLMWLWTLGAYEVVRTMAQAQRCFSARFLAELSDLKVALERVRVPNTKMERIKYDRRARSVPVRSDRGPDVWDAARKDLLVGDPADAVSARRLLASYARVMTSLTAADVLMRHEALFEA